MDKQQNKKNEGYVVVTVNTSNKVGDPKHTGKLVEAYQEEDQTASLFGVETINTQDDYYTSSPTGSPRTTASGAVSEQKTNEHERK